MVSFKVFVENGFGYRLWYGLGYGLRFSSGYRLRYGLR